MSGIMMAALASLPAKRWTLVATSTTQTATTLSFPVVANSGDLALLLWSSTVAGTAPSGWAIMATGASTQYYRICTGGESTVARPATGQGVVIILRAIGGSPSYSSGISQSPTSTSQSLTSIASPGLLVSLGNSTVAVSNFALTAPGTNILTPINLTSAPALYVAIHAVDANTALTNLRVTGSGSPRQTFAIFGIS